MTRRSRLDIYLVILGIINDGTSKPTRIMYRANISWKPLQENLELMVSTGVISCIDTSISKKHDGRTNKHFEITEKGKNIIKYFKRAGTLFGDIPVQTRARGSQQY